MKKFENEESDRGEPGRPPVTPCALAWHSKQQMWFDSKNDWCDNVAIDKHICVQTHVSTCTGETLERSSSFHAVPEPGYRIHDWDATTITNHVKQQVESAPMATRVMHVRPKNAAKAKMRTGVADMTARCSTASLWGAFGS